MGPWAPVNSVQCRPDDCVEDQHCPARFGLACVSALHISAGVIGFLVRFRAQTVESSPRGTQTSRRARVPEVLRSTAGVAMGSLSTQQRSLVNPPSRVPAQAQPAHMGSSWHDTAGVGKTIVPCQPGQVDDIRAVNLHRTSGFRGH